MIKSAVIFITQACNFRCPYCIHGKMETYDGDLVERFSAQDWARAINKLGPDIVDFTGGEPFLFPGFVELLKNLDLKTKIGITTNASLDLTEFVGKISPERVANITLSYHPTSFVTFDILLGKALMLIHRGYSVGVNYVAYPEQLFLIPQYAQRFAALGVRFHVETYVQNETAANKYVFSAEELNLIAAFSGGDRPVSYADNSGNKPVLCSAGRTHLSIHPNGDAWRCLNDRFNHKADTKLGNIFDESFAVKAEDDICYERFRCCGCDRDKVTAEESRLSL